MQMDAMHEYNTDSIHFNIENVYEELDIFCE